MAATHLPTPATLQIAAFAREFHRRGWMLGTSGNLSALVSRTPFRLVITPAASAKAAVDPEQLPMLDADGRVVGGKGAPSHEWPVHLAVVRGRRAGAVLHTHSIWGALLSERHARDEGLRIEGYEMLKELAGVETHLHAEWLPIVENTQDMKAMARTVGDVLAAFPAAHGILVRRHGLFTWGADLEEAARHLEALEYLLEAAGRLEAPESAADPQR